MFEFGNTSLKRLETCHKDIQTLMLYAILTSPIDFGIAQGERTYDQQLEYFLAGKSKIDPRVPSQLLKAKHVTSEKNPKARAVDIFAWVQGKKELMYDDAHLAFLGGHILKCSQELLAQGKITHSIRWGANWDGDGELIYDQTLKDLPHYEIID